MKKSVLALLGAMLLVTSACSGGGSPLPAVVSQAQSSPTDTQFRQPADCNVQALGGERHSMCMACPDGTIADTCASGGGGGFAAPPANPGSNPTGCVYVFATRAKSTCTTGGGGGVAAGPYRTPDQRACNDKGGVYLTDNHSNGKTFCSTDQLLHGFFNYDSGCQFWVTTFASFPSGTGFSIIPKPFSPVLPVRYNNTYGVTINANCSVTSGGTVYSDPSAGA